MADLFRTKVGPALRQQPGYLTSRFLTNGETNRCLAVVLWDSAAYREVADTSDAL